jgi:hypothetical protein
MAITELYSGSASISTTEYSCTANTTGISAVTTDGVFQPFLDLSDMIAGDQLQIRIYEKCRSVDTQRTIYEAYLTGPQADPLWVGPSLILMHGWDVTLDAISGTILVNWSIRQVA